MMTELQNLYLWLETLNRYPIEGNDAIKKKIQLKIKDIQNGV
jgi:hypothetical protein